MWEWHEKERKKWHQFSPADSAKFDQALQSGQSTVRTTIPHPRGFDATYEIDVVKKTQTNLHTKFVREIRQGSATAGAGSATAGTGLSTGVRAPWPLNSQNGARQDLRHVRGQRLFLVEVTEASKVQLQQQAAAGEKYWVKDTNCGDGACTVCMEPLKEDLGTVVRLKDCAKCFYHEECIRPAFSPSGRCPLCQKFYGLRIGNMPVGSMEATRLQGDLEGSTPGSGCIRIVYNIPKGVQTAEHPNPGEGYPARVEYTFLPGSSVGLKLAELLKIAFLRRLTFTVGTSVTTGQANRVTWNGIHHKTKTFGGSTSYGYPDDDYVRRLLDELEGVGVLSAADKVALVTMPV